MEGDLKMRRRSSQGNLIKILLLALGIFVVALIVVLILMLATQGSSDPAEQQINLKENGVYIEGISIDGIDVSGMTYAQAQMNEDIKARAQALEDSFTYAFTVHGAQQEYAAAELGLTSNRELILEEALYFGQVGDGATQREQQEQARETGVDFALAIYADEATVLERITALKAELDVLPSDATLKIADDVTGDGRFTVIDEVTGVDVDAAQLTKLITANINNGDFSVVDAPVIITNPKIDAATLKANTQLIRSFTSSFGGSKTLYDPDRVTNIRLMASIVNGTIIQPGEIWSINDAAGPRDDRTAKTVGWTYAPGINDGKYRMEVGGGVCQVSSTVYNAAILSELVVVERKQHSWPSSYIEKGMDATISTGGPDLKLSNPFDMPVYIAASVNEDEKTVTVEIYGPPPKHEYTIKFINKLVATDKASDSVYHYNATKDPDGNAIGEGKKVEWVTPRDAQTWEVYKQYLDKNGNVVKSELFSKDTYKAFTGVYYVNGQDPESVLPTLAPDDDE
jgi:vancomycin resistance protein YoaR